MRLYLRNKHVAAVFSDDVLRNVQAQDRPVVRVENVVCENPFHIIVGDTVPIVGYPDRNGLSMFMQAYFELAVFVRKVEDVGEDIENCPGNLHEVAGNQHRFVRHVEYDGNAFFSPRTAVPLS